MQVLQLLEVIYPLLTIIGLAYRFQNFFFHDVKNLPKSCVVRHKILEDFLWTWQSWKAKSISHSTRNHVWESKWNYEFETQIHIQILFHDCTWIKSVWKTFFLDTIAISDQMIHTTFHKKFSHTGVLHSEKIIFLRCLKTSKSLRILLEISNGSITLLLKRNK